MAGYIVFKEIMWHKHIAKLEDKLLSKKPDEYVPDLKGFNPEDKKITMAEADTTIPLEDADNPFVREIIRHPVPTASVS